MRRSTGAARAGGKADPGVKQDYGFMYGRSFEDPDGHHLGSDVDGHDATMPEGEPPQLVRGVR